MSRVYEIKLFFKVLLGDKDTKYFFKLTKNYKFAFAIITIKIYDF